MCNIIMSKLSKKNKSYYVNLSMEDGYICSQDLLNILSICDFSCFLFRNGCLALCVGGCLWLWTLTFSAVHDKIFIQYLKSKISNTRREDGLYLVKSSHRRSVLTSRAPKTSSRIWIKSLLSSVKVWGSGSRPLSVRNFNRTVKIKTERWGLRG